MSNIIEKAYIVWHDGMLDNDPLEGYTFSSLPVTYAKTPGKAKMLATEPHC